MNRPENNLTAVIKDWKWDIPENFNIGEACSDRQINLGNGKQIAGAGLAWICL